MPTWYVLEGGDVADPAEIVRGPGGRLQHKDGRAVAYAPHGPRSRNVDPETARAKTVESAKAPAETPSREMTADDDKPASADREMKPAAGGRPYRTRGTLSSTRKE